MTKILFKLNKTHWHKLAKLFKGELSITDRSFYANVVRLEHYIALLMEEVLENCIKISPENRTAYYELILHKLKSIIIKYDREVLEHKLKKYDQSENDFPEFSNYHLKQMLYMVPSESVSGLTPEALAHHSLLTQLHNAFFKYWMNIKKKELENWLKNLLEIVPIDEEPEKDASSPLGTLYRKVAYCDKRALITAIEEEGGDVARELAELLGRPINKVQLQLEKLGKKSSEIAPNSRQEKDDKIVNDFIAFGKKGR